MQWQEGVVRSADGTEIAYARAGPDRRSWSVDPAGGYSGFDNLGGLAALLAADFTVWRFDRRGRGRSGDTPPYAVAREVEDLAAVIDAAGGSARLRLLLRRRCSPCTRPPRARRSSGSR